jgi:hypothetical protein
VRSPRIEEKRTYGKDVKNRGNELNNSFGINKSVKKTNSKRTGFACKDEQLKAKKGPNSAREGEAGVASLGCRPCIKTYVLNNCLNIGLIAIGIRCLSVFEGTKRECL